MIDVEVILKLVIEILTAILAAWAAWKSHNTLEEVKKLEVVPDAPKADRPA